MGKNADELGPMLGHGHAKLRIAWSRVTLTGTCVISRFWVQKRGEKWVPCGENGVKYMSSCGEGLGAL